MPPHPSRASSAAARLPPLPSDRQRQQVACVQIQRVWRGWRVRRSIVFDVRDEFRALQAEVERKATVHAIRQQQQQQQASQQDPAQIRRHCNTAAAVSSVLAAATPAVYARPSTLCRPHWPSPPAAPVPVLAADGASSTPPLDRSIAGSKLSEHDDASEEEKKDGADSASMRAPGPSLHVSSPSLTDSLLAAQAVAAPSTAAAASMPFSPRTALDVHILGVQAAIRQRLLHLRQEQHASAAASEFATVGVNPQG